MDDTLETIRTLYNDLKKKNRGTDLDLVQLGIATPAVRDFFIRLKELLESDPEWNDE